VLGARRESQWRGWGVGGVGSEDTQYTQRSVPRCNSNIIRPYPHRQNRPNSQSGQSSSSSSQGQQLSHSGAAAAAAQQQQRHSSSSSRFNANIVLAKAKATAASKTTVATAPLFHGFPRLLCKNHAHHEIAEYQNGKHMTATFHLKRDFK